MAAMRTYQQPTQNGHDDLAEKYAQKSLGDQVSGSKLTLVNAAAAVPFSLLDASCLKIKNNKQQTPSAGAAPNRTINTPTVIAARP